MSRRKNGRPGGGQPGRPTGTTFEVTVDECTLNAAVVKTFRSGTSPLLEDVGGEVGGRLARQAEIRHLRMGVEQEEGDPATIQVPVPRNTRERWRLAGGGPLSRTDGVAARTPSRGDALAVGGIRRRRRTNRRREKCQRDDRHPDGPQLHHQPHIQTNLAARTRLDTKSSCRRFRSRHIRARQILQPTLEPQPRPPTMSQ